MNIIAPVTLAAASLVLGTRSTSEGSCLLFFIHQGRADSAILQVEKRFKGKELEERDGMGEVPKRTWGRLDHAAKGAKSTGYRGDASSILVAGVPCSSCTAVCRREALALRHIAQRGPRGPIAVSSIVPMVKGGPSFWRSLNVLGHCACHCSCFRGRLKPGDVARRRKERVLEPGAAVVLHQERRFQAEPWF